VSNPFGTSAEQQRHALNAVNNLFPSPYLYFRRRNSLPWKDCHSAHAAAVRAVAYEVPSERITTWLSVDDGALLAPPPELDEDEEPLNTDEEPLNEDSEDREPDFGTQTLNPGAVMSTSSP
jgi:hypothetical protein